MKKCRFILRIGEVDEHNRFVKVDAVVDQLSRRVQVVRRRITLDTAIQEFVLRKPCRHSSDKAVLPEGHSLGGRVAQDEDPGPGAGGRYISDALVAKTQTIGVELVRVSSHGRMQKQLGWKAKLRTGSRAKQKPCGPPDTADPKIVAV